MSEGSSPPYLSQAKVEQGPVIAILILHARLGLESCVAPATSMNCEPRQGIPFLYLAPKLW